MVQRGRRKYEGKNKNQPQDLDEGAAANLGPRGRRTTKMLRGARTQTRGEGHFPGGSGAMLCNLGGLKVWDRPNDATILAVSARSGVAFVDAGVGRRRGRKNGGVGGGQGLGDAQVRGCRCWRGWQRQ